MICVFVQAGNECNNHLKFEGVLGDYPSLSERMQGLLGMMLGSGIQVLDDDRFISCVLCTTGK